MQIKETINYFCHVLEFFGNRTVKSEDLRKAKHNDPLSVKISYINTSNITNSYIL